MRNTGKEFKYAEGPVVLVTLFRLPSRHQWWAFRQMGLAKQYFRRQPGLRFGEMLGTGKGRGFSIFPNFKRYALFSCWDSLEQARKFLAESPLYQHIHAKAEEVYTMELQPVMSKGLWQGVNPFEPVSRLPEGYKGPLVVLTRARIRLSKAFQFWRNVAGVSHETSKATGLLAQTGVGEVPLIQQGTISIWENEEHLKAFAYGMREHKAVVRKTRSQQWYREELFARFVPLSAAGSWNGQNPLQEYLPFSKIFFKEQLH